MADRAETFTEPIPLARTGDVQVHALARTRHGAVELQVRRLDGKPLGREVRVWIGPAGVSWLRDLSREGDRDRLAEAIAEHGPEEDTDAE